MSSVQKNMETAYVDGYKFVADFTATYDNITGYISGEVNNYRLYVPNSIFDVPVTGLSNILQSLPNGYIISYQMRIVNSNNVTLCTLCSFYPGPEGEWSDTYYANPGDYTIQLSISLQHSYGGSTVPGTMFLNVPEPKVIGISCDTDKVDKDFYVYETFNSTNLIVYENYDNNVRQTTKKYVVSDVDTSTSGTKTVTITYEDNVNFTTYYDIIVHERTLEILPSMESTVKQFEDLIFTATTEPQYMADSVQWSDSSKLSNDDSGVGQSFTFKPRRTGDTYITAKATFGDNESLIQSVKITVVEGKNYKIFIKDDSGEYTEAECLWVYNESTSKYTPAIKIYDLT